MPLSDHARLGALDSLESCAALPESCDPRLFLDEGLIEPDDSGGWRLTIQGRLSLANLRSLERQRQKA